MLLSPPATNKQTNKQAKFINAKINIMALHELERKDKGTIQIGNTA
jgi:hypothetical protein